MSAEYRLSGEATFPAQIDDVEAVLRWLREHGTELGADPERVGIAGYSAGAHLAALAAARFGNSIRTSGAADGPAQVRCAFVIMSTTKTAPVAMPTRGQHE